MSLNTPSSLTEGRDYDAFREFLQETCGIALGANKQYLVQTRVRRILAEHKIEGLGALVSMLGSRSHSALREQVVDAMTTNETFWFRDKYPYEQLRDNLLAEFGQKPGNIRIWSAACSSGQEPYSISMMTDECKRKNPGALKGEVEVVATDLSPSMLDQCKRAEYDRLSIVRGLSTEQVKQYFDEKEGELWVLKPALRRRVTFKPLNLLSPYHGLGKFDMVFCRNVLIYFTDEVKRDILTRIHGVLKPGGILFLGSSENISGLNDLYDMVHCRPGILYRAK